MGELFWIIDDEWSGYGLEEARIGAAFPGAAIRYSKHLGGEGDAALAAEATAVIAQIGVPVDASFIGGLAKCRAISVYGIGYNNVDVAAATAKGIPVCNVPGYCAEDVADYVIAAVYDYNKQLGDYSAALGDGKWGALACRRMVRRVSSQTMLVLGFGAIGRVTAEKAAALGMRVLYYDKVRTPQMEVFAARIGAAEAPSLEQGLAEADVVAVHLALTPETTGFLGAGRLALMKPGSHLVNAARGPVVDEAALVEAVKAGRPARATLDVVAHEPPSPGDPVLNTPGIVVTPHVSYLSQESLDTLQIRAAENAIACLRGDHAAAAIVNRAELKL